MRYLPWHPPSLLTRKNIDGTGYPKGLKGKDIPLGARILGIADAYQAMVEHRYYREARTHEEAVTELQKVRRITI